MRVVRPVLKEMECRLGVLLRIERDIETGLRQCEAKKFTLAEAVFDQENGGVRHHIKEDISREYAGLKNENGDGIIIRNNS